jgi:hypothetical protein
LLEIVPLEPLMNSRTARKPRPSAAASSADAAPLRIPEETHRPLRFVVADTGESMGEAATRFMLAGGLKEAASKAKP